MRSGAGALDPAWEGTMRGMMRFARAHTRFTAMPTFASLTIGFLVLAAIFFVIERVSPGTRGQRRLRR